MADGDHGSKFSVSSPCKDTHPAYDVSMLTSQRHHLLTVSHGGGGGGQDFNIRILGGRKHLVLGSQETGRWN